MADVSTDIQWQVIRKSSSFLRRQRGIKKHFSREKFNLKGVNSIRYNGLIHKKAIDVRPTADNKGIVVTLKKKRKARFPAESTTTITLKHHSRKSLKSVRNIAKHYRRSLTMVALRRASQFLRSQRNFKGRKGHNVGKVES